MLMLDLFSGLGGASEAFKQHPDWDVIRVDNEPWVLQEVPETCIADINDVQSQGRWWQPHVQIDLLWASPPCTEFSTARCPPIQNPDLTLIKRTISLIEAINPRCWIIENVRGSIKHFAPLLGPPRLILGPYVFWGNFPLFWVNMEGYSKMESDPWSDDPLRPQKRALIPLQISEALLESLRTQCTLERFFIPAGGWSEDHHQD